MSTFLQRSDQVILPHIYLCWLKCLIVVNILFKLQVVGASVSPPKQRLWSSAAALCDCRAVRIRTSTVRFPPTCSCPRTEVVCGLLQVCSSHSAPSMPRGFHSTNNYASLNSARGHTTASSSICNSPITRNAASNCTTTSKMANGQSLVGLQYLRQCSYRQHISSGKF